jgi:hypothetical protein
MLCARKPEKLTEQSAKTSQTRGMHIRMANFSIRHAPISAMMLRAAAHRPICNRRYFDFSFSDAELMQ